MRQVVLLGSPGTKRTIYLEKAAEQKGLPIVFTDWNSWNDCRRLPVAEELFVKIDPPLWSSCSLEELNGLADGYIRQLEELGSYAQKRKMTFLNIPSAMIELLDKRACKARLQQAGLPVTEIMQTYVCLNTGKLTAELLFEEMHRQRMHQVFIKPVKGSGAAGVSALRWQPQTGRMALYSCALLQADGTFVNTKCLRRFSKTEEVFPLLDRILEMDCIVEQWYAKAEYQGYSYDLRAVVQDGRLDFLLGRLSKGPITNLHLNNRPLETAALKLPAHTLDDIAKLCQKSMEIYPGLRSAGIDILLEKGSMKPRIIEMNAQGDLIYQDIYNKNSIYGHQAEMMRQWLCGK
ncbi:MAG: STM4014 family protein [Lachnospiraceae bacterium]|nr:STM4014 family protein [Lachnospiraceae bacterium]